MHYQLDGDPCFFNKKDKFAYKSFDYVKNTLPIWTKKYKYVLLQIIKYVR